MAGEKKRKQCTQQGEEKLVKKLRLIYNAFQEGKMTVDGKAEEDSNVTKLLTSIHVPQTAQDGGTELEKPAVVAGDGAADKEKEKAAEEDKRAAETTQWLAETEITRQQFVKLVAAADQAIHAAEKDGQDCRGAKDARLIGQSIVDIIAYWQTAAGPGRAATRLPLPVAQGLCITLLQVFQLVPEAYQSYIKINDPKERDDAEGGYSWLCEHLLNGLIQIEIQKYAGSMENYQNIKYSRAFTSFARQDVDLECYLMNPDVEADGILEHLVEKLKKKEDESEWNPQQTFTFPSTTKKIVYLWGYTLNHWILVESTIDSSRWTHHIYNPDSGKKPEEHSAFTSFKMKMPYIEKLIRAASGIPAPTNLNSAIVNQETFQQRNTADCGIIAVGIAIDLLFGKKVDGEYSTTSEGRRGLFLKEVRDWLEERKPLPKKTSG